MNSNRWWDMRGQFCCLCWCSIPMIQAWQAAKFALRYTVKSLENWSDIKINVKRKFQRYQFVLHFTFHSNFLQRIIKIFSNWLDGVYETIFPQFWQFLLNNISFWKKQQKKWIWDTFFIFNEKVIEFIKLNLIYIIS